MYSKDVLAEKIIGNADFPKEESYNTDRLRIKKWG